jgi:hypothetical protein
MDRGVQRVRLAPQDAEPQPHNGSVQFLGVVRLGELPRGGVGVIDAGNDRQDARAVLG